MTERIRREWSSAQAEGHQCGPTSTLPGWWAHRLAVLLDALGDIPVAPAERASLAILARQDLTTVLHLADLLRRCRLSVLGGEPE